MRSEDSLVGRATLLHLDETIQVSTNPALLSKLRPFLELPPWMSAPHLASPDGELLVSMGASGAGLPLHQHGDAWLLQLSGTKLWRFI